MLADSRAIAEQRQLEQLEQQAVTDGVAAATIAGDVTPDIPAGVQTATQWWRLRR